MNHTRKGVGAKGGGASPVGEDHAFRPPAGGPLGSLPALPFPLAESAASPQAPSPPPGSGLQQVMADQGSGRGGGGRLETAARPVPASGAREAGGRGYPRPHSPPCSCPACPGAPGGASAATDLSPENRPCRGRRPSNLSHRSVGGSSWSRREGRGNDD